MDFCKTSVISDKARINLQNIFTGMDILDTELFSRTGSAQMCVKKVQKIFSANSRHNITNMFDYLKSYRHWAVQTCYTSFLKGLALV